MREQEHTMDATLKALGDVIAGERKKRRLSRQMLADLSEISFKQMGNIERGQRGQFAETLRVAAALGIPLSRMLKEAEELAARQGAAHEGHDGTRDVG